MSTRTAITEVAATLLATRQRLAEVSQMAGDHPTSGETVVVDLVRDACDDLEGWLAAASTAAEAAIRSATIRRTTQVAEDLSATAEATERALATYITGIGGVDSITRLRDLAADQGRAWQAWAWAILEGLDPVWTHLMTARADLDQSWRELVEHLLSDPVEVREHLPSPASSPTTH